MKMYPTIISLPLLITMLSVYTTSVHCRIRPSVEKIASDYIVSRLFPSHSILASKLLNVLVKSVEENYENEQEDQLQYNDESDDVVDETDDERSNNVRLSDDSQGVLSSDEEDISEAGLGGSSSIRGSSSISSSSSSRDSLEGIMRRASRQQQPQRNQQFGFGRRIRRLQTQKRGLGHCIHKCINGQGGMNFIQCKNMCH